MDREEKVKVNEGHSSWTRVRKIRFQARAKLSEKSPRSALEDPLIDQRTCVEWFLISCTSYKYVHSYRMCYNTRLFMDCRIWALAACLSPISRERPGGKCCPFKLVKHLSSDLYVLTNSSHENKPKMTTPSGNGPEDLPCQTPFKTLIHYEFNGNSIAKNQKNLC